MQKRKQLQTFVGPDGGTYLTYEASRQVVSEVLYHLFAADHSELLEYVQDLGDDIRLISAMAAGNMEVTKPLIHSDEVTRNFCTFLGTEMIAFVLMDPSFAGYCINKFVRFDRIPQFPLFIHFLVIKEIFEFTERVISAHSVRSSFELMEGIAERSELLDYMSVQVLNFEAPVLDYHLSRPLLYTGEPE